MFCYQRADLESWHLHFHRADLRASDYFQFRITCECSEMAELCRVIRISTFAIQLWCEDASLPVVNFNGSATG